jgi:hypothetical protein
MVSLVFTLILLLRWRSLAIRAVEMDNEHIVLDGVSERFVQAMRERRGLSRSRAMDVSLSPSAGGEGQPTPGLRGWGFALLALGVGAMVLPLLGLQFRALAQLGDGARVLGGLLAVIGTVLLIVASFRVKRIDQTSEPDEEESGDL